MQPTPQNAKMPILPVEAYTSQAWFDAEMKHIFSNTWQFAGLIEDVKDPGDYVTVQCGLYNIMVVKGRDQRLRAFHNICRHRGTQLLRAVGKKQKAITCPYHDWTYDLGGNLISVPEKETEFPDLDMKQFCLHKASVETWRGMIFVHPKPDAAPLMEWFDGVEEYLGPHDPEMLVEYEGTAGYEKIKANWKIVAENYIDGYHLAHLHSTTLNMYDHLKQETGFVGPHFVFWEPLSPFYRDNLDDLIPFKRIEQMTDEYIGAYVPLLFPNLGLSETESSWSIFHIIPVAPDETHVVLRSKAMPMTDWEYSKQASRSEKAWTKRMKNEPGYEKGEGAHDPMSSGDFMKEDIFACEQQQKSLKSPLFSIGATAANLESSVRGFQQIVAS
ncbi:MAG: aromatic ring-hydroxylating dioxygenase subunit alpha, partial [Bacteroidota bacterium]